MPSADSNILANQSLHIENVKLLPYQIADDYFASKVSTILEAEVEVRQHSGLIVCLNPGGGGDFEYRVVNILKTSGTWQAKCVICETIVIINFYASSRNFLSVLVPTDIPLASVGVSLSTTFSNWECRQSIQSCKVQYEVGMLSVKALERTGLTWRQDSHISETASLEGFRQPMKTGWPSCWSIFQEKKRQCRNLYFAFPLRPHSQPWWNPRKTVLCLSVRICTALGDDWYCRRGRWLEMLHRCNHIDVWMNHMINLVWERSSTLAYPVSTTKHFSIRGAELLWAQFSMVSLSGLVCYLIMYCAHSLT